MADDSFDDAFDEHYLRFSDFERRAYDKRDGLRGISSDPYIGMMYLSLCAAEEAGEIAGKVKKAYRDAYEDRMKSFPAWEKAYGREVALRYMVPHGDSLLSGDARMAVIKEIGDVLWYLGALCRRLGTNLAFVAITNCLKLEDRDRRNAHRGEGDDR